MAATLPVFQTDNKQLMLLQTSWKTILSPGLANPIMQGTLLRNISLINGQNTINHLLDRPLLGWFVTRQNALANIYDAQNGNSMPNLTLVLVSDAAVTIDLYVF